MKKAIVYRSQLLPRSETFVRQQVLALRNWTPVVVGERRVPGGLDLGDMDVRLLSPQPSTRLDRIHYGMARWLRRPYPPITRQIASVGAGVLHVHFGTDAVDLWPHVRALDLPVLVTLHGYDINIHREWWEGGHGGLRRRSYPARLIELANQPRVAFVAVSEAILNRAIEYGISRDKVEVRYIGVDTQRFRPGEVPIAVRAKRVLFVGRLVEKKGVSCLIRAFAGVQRRVADAELVVVGDGPLRGELGRLAVELGVPARFLGARTSDEILREMHAARALCLPSVTARNGDAEGLPIVILEAQAAGLPVITSAKGGVGEAVLDGQTGHPFAEHDVEHLGDLIVRALEDDDTAAGIAAAARRHVEHTFDLAACTRRLERSYDRLASAGCVAPDVS